MWARSKHCLMTVITQDMNPGDGVFIKREQPFTTPSNQWLTANSLLIHSPLYLVVLPQLNMGWLQLYIHVQVLEWGLKRLKQNSSPQNCMTGFTVMALLRLQLKVWKQLAPPRAGFLLQRGKLWEVVRYQWNWHSDEAGSASGSADGIPG